MQLFTAALILAKNWKQAKYPSTELLNNVWSIHTLGGYSTVKRTEALVYLTW